MNTTVITKKAIQYVKDIHKNQNEGHDWWHIYRVWNTAKEIQRQEGGTLFTIEMAVLLHDVDDYKLTSQIESGERATYWLAQQNIDSETAEHIIQIIQEVSFTGAKTNDEVTSLESQIVQDADRLDAIGAIGIARTFAFGGNHERVMYDPEEQPIMHQTFEEYKTSTGTTINHFYEKLLLLKDKMKTKTGIKIAKERHEFMKIYLEQFYKEWGIKKV